MADKRNPVLGRCPQCAKSGLKGTYVKVGEAKDSRGNITERDYKCSTCGRKNTLQAMAGTSL